MELCVTPDIEAPTWRSISLPAGIDYSSQGEGDLGDRLARAAQRVIEGGEAVLLIGTDAPGLDASRLRQAAILLREADATLFSVVDGGYVLLGLNRYHRSVFEGIPWSTDSVAAATLSRIGQLGWTVRSGPMLHDIDEPRDLKWLPVEWRKMIDAQGDTDGHDPGGADCRPDSSL